MRYQHDPRLSSIVDMLTDFEEEMADTGDTANEERAHQARLIVLEMALGTKR